MLVSNAYIDIGKSKSVANVLYFAGEHCCKETPSAYEQIREGTAKQVNFARAEQVFSLSHTNAIIPPPLNVLVFAFSIVWFAMEFLVWLMSCGTYILNIEKLVPVNIAYDIGRAIKMRETLTKHR